jgi:uncharacterized protein YfiM (DUF2279 family)
MKRIVCLFLALMTLSFGFGQKLKFNENSDTLSKKRFAISSGLVAGTWISGTIALSQVWYEGFQKSAFHTFDDCGDWLQMDKVGHVYTAAHISEANYRLFTWTGLSKRKSAWIGAGIGFGFQTTLEVLDGRNSDWGFSWCDMAANGLGSGLFLGQQLAWNEQRIVLKFSSHPTEYAAYRPNVLGSTAPERFFKDYNGQTYWLSFSPQKFTSKWPLPAWICFSFGYSVDEKLVGSEEFFVSNDRTFQSKRQFLFSLDLDVRELPIKKKWLKTLLRPLHYVKFPFPTLILTGDQLSGKWLYF